MVKVFLSWSGEPSRAVALGLRTWLPDVLQAVSPWMSVADISAGARWNRDIDRELSETSFGILCLSSDNLGAPWLLFEAGALAKAIDQARVCPYLLGIEPSDIPSGPLTQFQAKRATKTETYELLQAINAALADRGLSAAALERAFELWWPRLEDILAEAAARLPAPAMTRPPPEMLTEVLNEVRSISRRLSPPPRTERRRSGLSEEKKELMLAQFETICEMVFQHPEVKKRGISRSGACFGNDEFSLTPNSPRGELRAIVRVQQWDRVDDEALVRMVVAPLVGQLLTEYDSKAERSV